MTTNLPQFTHDCDQCVFLGDFISEDWNHIPVDLYFCPSPKTPEFSTIIARYGDDGPEYGSGLTFAGGADHYREAARRSILANLIPHDTDIGRHPPATLAQASARKCHKCGLRTLESHNGITVEGVEDLCVETCVSPECSWELWPPETLAKILDKQKEN